MPAAFFFIRFPTANWFIIWFHSTWVCINFKKPNVFVKHCFWSLMSSFKWNCHFFNNKFVNIWTQINFQILNNGFLHILDLQAFVIWKCVFFFKARRFLPLKFFFLKKFNRYLFTHKKIHWLDNCQLRIRKKKQAMKRHKIT